MSTKTPPAISDQNQRLEELIARSKNHYEQVIDAMTDSICVVDHQFLIQSANKSFARAIRRPIKKIKGLSFFSVISRYAGLGRDWLCPDCPQTCVLKDVFRTGRTVFFEQTAHTPKDAKYYFQKTVFPVKNRRGETYQLVIVIRDITLLKEREVEIKRLHEFNNRILNSAPISIVVLDKSGRIVSANERASDMIADPDGAIVGKNLLKTSEIVKNVPLREAYADLLKNGKSFQNNSLSYFSRRSGQRKSLNIIAVPLSGTDGRREGALSMAIDNTEEVAAKEALEKLNRRLEEMVLQRTAELDQANRQLNQALDLKLKFIADASHELRTPLTIIKGNIDLAIQEINNQAGAVPEIYQVITGEIDRLGNIITDLTMLSNMDVRNETLHYEKINLFHLLQRIVRSLRVLADQKHIILTPLRPARQVVVAGDEAKLEKLLLNIVRNAIKYTPPRGRVRIWAESDGAQARLSVQDNGIGIPDKDQPYIFERFYRVDKSRSREEGGTGLGLSIAKWIAEAHGGQITIQSALGKGSKFTVHLPFNLEKLPPKEN
ncbi:hypothetical protein COX22_04555 [Candidatus Falkowbacteria bacterium CG23_combo_of_CG06-09_8_20_14_all_49_15]|uniref:histidine kinase n=1 Tax=Candidatus Falkowbacteria bacterium CG23_combo_of_CG06-09_8_20_14_all_49_15 TaxID=1974572 RepID=A0A2G9ZJP4_9BACT|nr:MAG: hypothetical protein COX22_04555 [Candidatus Falkowbacteria bacterium CG23_combo_of_CG06-09_8_20_14_all_49_15]